MPGSDIQIRHHINLQRFISHQVSEFEPFLKEIRANILSRLSDDLTSFSRSRLERQLKSIVSAQRKIYKKYFKDLNKALIESALNEAEFERSAIIKTYPNVLELSSPAAAKIEAAIYSAPFNIGNKSGVLMKEFLKTLEDSQIKLIEGAIRQGWYEGQALGTITKGVGDILKSNTRRANEAVVRTALNHTSQVARSQVWEANDDIIKGWRFLAVLDSRTTDICSGISSLNEVYKIGEGPLPPRHYACRSTTLAVLIDKFKPTSDVKQASFGAAGGKQVSGKLTYYEWLKTQPPSYVRDRLGKTRGDLFLSGKLGAKQFAEFGLNSRYEPLTIKEMIAKDKRLNLNLFDEAA